MLLLLNILGYGKLILHLKHLNAHTTAHIKICKYHGSDPLVTPAQ